jgi:2,3-bisphosphoglycerate-independent phosphoglycerate mutase
MVGHTGIYEAVLCSLEAMDLCLARLKEAVKQAGGVMIISADHGNSDDMFEHEKNGAVKYKKDGRPQAKTSHSLNPVPCIIYDPSYAGDYDLKLREGLGISSLTAACIEFLGLTPPEDFDPSVIQWKA